MLMQLIFTDTVLFGKNPTSVLKVLKESQYIFQNLRKARLSLNFKKTENIPENGKESSLKKLDWINGSLEIESFSLRIFESLYKPL